MFFHGGGLFPPGVITESVFSDGLFLNGKLPGVFGGGVVYFLHGFLLGSLVTGVFCPEFITGSVFLRGGVFLMGFITVRYWESVFFLGDIFSMIYYCEYFFSGWYCLHDLSLGMFFWDLFTEIRFIRTLPGNSNSSLFGVIVTNYLMISLRVSPWNGVYYFVSFSFRPLLHQISEIDLVKMWSPVHPWSQCVFDLTSHIYLRQIQPNKPFYSYFISSAPLWHVKQLSNNLYWTVKNMVHKCAWISRVLKLMYRQNWAILNHSSWKCTSY